MDGSSRTTNILRIAWLASAALALFTILQFYQAGIWFQDASGHLRLHDFAVFWTAAKRVLAGQAALIYDRAAHEAFEAALTGQPLKRGLAYPYPPSSLLFIWPLGLAGYGVAWLAFATAGLVSWFAVLRRIVRDWPLALGMSLAIGAGTHSLLLGQNGFVTASLVCGGMLLLPSRKALAGIAFGLLSLKPHLAATAFVALLIWREWRALQFAIGTVAILAAMTTLVFGFDIWLRFLAGNAGFADYVAASRATLIEPLMQSVLSLALRFTDWPVAAAIHGATALFSLCALSLLKESGHRGAGLPAAIVLVTPFSYFYDSTMLIGSAAFLLRGAKAPVELVLITSAAMLPGLWFVTGGQYGALAALMLLALTLNQARAADQFRLAR